MSSTEIISGISGAMGLFSGVKGLFDADRAARKQKRLLDEAKASENAWYKRNYYADYLNSSMARAAMKRVENTLHGLNRRNRAYAAVSGATPEQAVAANRQGLQAMEDVVTNLAAKDSDNKMMIDSMHHQNMNAIRNQQIAALGASEEDAVKAAAGGFNLLNNALLGVNWGREKL